MLSFSPSKQGVIAFDGGRSYRLVDWQCERLLDAFDGAGLIRPFNSLHEAHMACGGIPRVSSLREVA